MKNQRQFFSYFLFILLLSLSACTSDDRDQSVTPSGDYNQGVFVLNEGGFGKSNASVSFIDNNGQVSNQIFSSVNNSGLGDVAQSMGLYQDKAYVVVNNSSTIEVVNRYTFKLLATVKDKVMNPRYMAFYEDKGYVTNWGDPTNPDDDFVAVIDLKTNKVTAKISVPEGPEKIIAKDGKLYVAQKGGYNSGHTISVIDSKQQKLVGTLQVGDIPDGMVLNGGNLYVLCSGKAAFTKDETQAKLFKIDLQDTTKVESIDFNAGKHPGFLQGMNNQLYYALDNAVYSVNIGKFKISSTPVFSPAADGLNVIYGMAVNKGLIYLTDPKDYASNGTVFIYTAAGTLQKKFSAEIVPNGFYFNE